MVAGSLTGMRASIVSTEMKLPGSGNLTLRRSVALLACGHLHTIQNSHTRHVGIMHLLTSMGMLKQPSLVHYATGRPRRT
jgi:hypothetical protein